LVLTKKCAQLSSNNQLGFIFDLLLAGGDSGGGNSGGGISGK